MAEECLLRRLPFFFDVDTDMVYYPAIFRAVVQANVTVVIDGAEPECTIPVNYQ